MRQYLNQDYKDWPGDWEGDFDYVDGNLRRHDWGDLAHGEMHERLIGHFSQQREKLNIRVLPSFTLQITPTRFRVPDLVIFGGDRSAQRNYQDVSEALWSWLILMARHSMFRSPSISAVKRPFA